MGHMRLGDIPKSQKWTQVISFLTSINKDFSSLLNLEIKDISKLVLEAAEKGLEKAINDIGLQYTFYLLTQIVLTSRDPEWIDKLQHYGIKLNSDSSLFDLISEVQRTIDDYLFYNGNPSDISEMAQKAIGNALLHHVDLSQGKLFQDDGEELKASIKKLSTKKGFSELGQTFFSHFIFQFLNFYLSRITADQVGGKTFQQIGDLTQFNNVLQKHCYESALIVHDFCGEWYSKTEFKEGINNENTSRFMAVAIKKMKSELQQQRELI